MNRTWSGLAHISDIGLTLLDAAGLAPLAPLPGRPVHGSSFWPALISNSSSARQDVVINVDYTVPAPQAAIVGVDGWKLVLGLPGMPGCECTYWSDRNGEPESPPPTADAPKGGAALQLGVGPVGAFWPLANMTPSLYHLPTDPRELNDVASANPHVVKILVDRLAVWGLGAIAVVENATQDPRSLPKHWGGSWTPWLGV